jgi:hypothetical protein
MSAFRHTTGAYEPHAAALARVTSLKKDLILEFDSTVLGTSFAANVLAQSTRAVLFHVALLTGVANMYASAPNSAQTKPLKPAWFLAVDHVTKSIVLGIRGTKEVLRVVSS